MSPALRRIVTALALLVVLPAVWAAGRGAMAQEMAVVRIAYLGRIVERPPVLANLDEAAEDEGRAGAELAVADNRTTGRFLKQDFTLEAVTLPEDGDATAALRGLIAAGHRLVVLDLPGAEAGALATGAATGAATGPLAAAEPEAVVEPHGVSTFGEHAATARVAASAATAQGERESERR